MPSSTAAIPVAIYTPQHSLIQRHNCANYKAKQPRLKHKLSPPIPKRPNAIKWQFTKSVTAKTAVSTFRKPYLGNRHTTVQHGEIQLKTLAGMLRDLEINRREF